MAKPSLVIHFTHLRAYHLARLRAAEDCCSDMFSVIQGIALCDHTFDIPADTTVLRPLLAPLILMQDGAYESASRAQIKRIVYQTLDRLRPSTIAICGYSTPDARACFRWARRNNARTILMTETRECDRPRVAWKEWIKSRIVRQFDNAICGGPEACDYLKKLGLPETSIEEGYDVVDNDFFTRECARIRAQASGGIQPYFLASNRFIERKNLARLVEAYAAYAAYVVRSEGSESRNSCPTSTIKNQQSTIINPSPLPWNLCLLGDGKLKSALVARCRELGLQVIESAPWEVPLSTSTINNQQSAISNQRSASSPSPDSCPLPPGIVYFPGWCQHIDLPRFYAHAGAFVHPSYNEPWGLVINEAMASSLSVIAGNGSGAAQVLIKDGQNGSLLESVNHDAIARAMTDYANLPADELSQLGQNSLRHIQQTAPCSKFGDALIALISRK